MRGKETERPGCCKGQSVDAEITSNYKMSCNENNGNEKEIKVFRQRCNMLVSREFQEI